MPRALKGLVLAAGLGTRLMPLTGAYPKPLVPFAGSTPLALALAALRRSGVVSLAVNASYLATKVDEFALNDLSLPPLYVSREEVPLGTGGVYNPLRQWIGNDDLLVLNGDIVADFDLPALIERHVRCGSVATMLLLPSTLPGEKAVFYDGQNVLGFGKVEALPPQANAGNFACAQILSPAFLDLMPKHGIFDVISKGYEVALNRGMKVAAQLHHGVWHDLRTPDYYWAALRDLLTQPALCERSGLAGLRQKVGMTPLPDDRGVLIGAGLMIPKTTTMGPLVVIETGAIIGAGSHLSHCAILPGAVVPSGTIVHGSVVGPNFSVTVA